MQPNQPNEIFVFTEPMEEAFYCFVWCVPCEDAHLGYWGAYQFPGQEGDYLEEECPRCGQQKLVISSPIVPCN